MDYVAIFGLIEKGLTVIKALYDAEQNAEPAIKATLELVTGAKHGVVTDDQLTATENLLDGLITDFNLPMD